MKDNKGNDSKDKKVYIYRGKNYKKESKEIISEKLEKAKTRYKEINQAFKEVEKGIEDTKAEIEDIDRSIEDILKPEPKIINPRNKENPDNFEEDQIKTGSGALLAAALEKKRDAREKLDDLSDSISDKNPDSLYFQRYDAKREKTVAELRSEFDPEGKKYDILHYAIDDSTQRHTINQLTGALRSTVMPGDFDQNRRNMAIDDTKKYRERSGLKNIPVVNSPSLFDNKEDDTKDNTKDNSTVPDASSNQKRRDLKSHSRIKNLDKLVKFFPDNVKKESAEDRLWMVHDILMNPDNTIEEKRSAVKGVINSLKDNNFMRSTANNILSGHIDKTLGNTGYGR